MRVVCIVLVNIFVHVIEGVKPKSVNLALETVLRFDKQNREADLEVISKVQKFLDTVKNVMTNYNGSRRHNKEELKLTDFIRESARILKTYDDDALEDVFSIIHNELRKYHYRGCKFYELVQNNDLRRLMSNKLEQVKATPATILRKYLDKVVTTIDKDEFKGRDRFLVDLLNSLYIGTSDEFSRTINGLKLYRARGSDTALSDFIAGVLRTLLFDHYSNLNDNARSQVSQFVQNYWITSNDNDHHKSVKDNKNKYQRLKVIDVNFNDKDILQWSKYVIYNQRPTPSKMIELSQMGFKVTGETLKTTSHTVSKSRGGSSIVTYDDMNSKIHKKKIKKTKSGNKENNHNKTKIDTIPQTDSAEIALSLKPIKVKKGKISKDHFKKQSKKKYKKATINRPKEMADGDSFEIANENIKRKKQHKSKVKVSAQNEIYSEISKSIKNVLKEKFKKNKVKLTEKVPVSKGTGVTNYYGHAVRSDEGFISDESLSLVDIKEKPFSIEDKAIGDRIKANVEFDPNSIGLLTGGQNIENMSYRSHKLKKKSGILRNSNKKVEDSANPEEILAEHSAVIDFELPVRNWKFITPQRSSVNTGVSKPHKHHRQRKNNKIKSKPGNNFETTDDIDTRKSFIAADNLASNEGMTIESFEKKDVKRIPMKDSNDEQNKKAANNFTSVKMEPLFSKLQSQLNSVQKQIELLQNSGVEQTTAKRESNSDPSFRAMTMAAEERTTTDKNIISKSTTTTVKITPELKPTTVTVSTTMATSVEIESISPKRTTSSTRTTSTSESAPIFRSQDNVKTSGNNNAAIEESVDTTKGILSTLSITAKEVIESATNDNTFKKDDFKEIETDKLSATEDSRLLLNNIIQNNPSLHRLRDLPLYTENEINATKQISAKVTEIESTTNHQLNGLEEYIPPIVHKPDVNE